MSNELAHALTRGLHSVSRSIIKKSTIFERIRMNRLVSMAVSAESSNEEVAPLVGLALVVSAPKPIGKHEGKDTNPK